MIQEVLDLYPFSVTILPDKRQEYLAREAPFILYSFLGLSLLLFGVEPQEFLFLFSLCIVTIQGIFNLSRS